MREEKIYAVLGLGRYGLAVAKELSASGAEVLAVDADADVVDAAAAFLPICKCADITDPEAIAQLGISNVDVAVIAVASDLESSILATTLCKEAGVPTVIAKCANEMHRRILTRVGADRVVFPENESGIRLAKSLCSAGFSDLLELSGEISLAELPVRPEWQGKALMQLGLRKDYGINVVAIRRGKTLTVQVDPTQALTADMTLLVLADTKELKKLK